MHASLQLDPFAGLDRGQLIGGDPGRAHRHRVEHADTALADRTHPQLGLRRHTELAHDDDVQGRLQCPGDLETDRDTAARQREDERGVVAHVVEPAGEQRAGLAPITEARRS